MPKRNDISSILIIGAGPIIIGQACEFDYSGTQAISALKSEGYRIILVNSNPATIMTDPDLAHATYIEPITPEVVTRIIEKERPCAILPTMGGQTALNVALALAERGVLERYGVEFIGANREAISKAENRGQFREAMMKIGLEMPRSGVANTLEQAYEIQKDIGFPIVVRSSFTLAGTGSGIAYDMATLTALVKSCLDVGRNAEVLLDESVVGWKEYEMEVVRDSKDNCIIVCAIENIDPMGVHTGDSITVAPALTLTDKEYQMMQNASIAVLREIGVDTGGSNVQFAINPQTGRMLVIEMNPRVSRSSALASKATGFSIAKVAAKLAVGYTLDELDNDLTKSTPASFEPTIDYVVTKIPRFVFEKFPGVTPELSTSMKSVGEVMGIGRTFKESFQKALRSMETNLNGFDRVDLTDLNELKVQSPMRVLKVGEALRQGVDKQYIYELCGIDPWFIAQFEDIIQAERSVQSLGLPKNAYDMRRLKTMGFSDNQLANLANITGGQVRKLRRDLGVNPVYKRIDSCAGEFDTDTNYFYSTYGPPFSEPEDESRVSERKKAIILGSGPNRIGQGIEFDYCCVHVAYALRECGIEAIMINCNPETVSTDYDTSDRLYFEPLTAEDVLEVCRLEQSRGDFMGVIVQFGGQTPLKIAQSLNAAGIPILGTTVDAIDLAEDRERFSNLVSQLGIKQPKSGIARSVDEAKQIADNILGYPVLLRPSYVLGGRAMKIVHDSANLETYMHEAVRLFGDMPILIDTFLNKAIEVDVDAICDGSQVFVAGIMQHIEEAGIHSGDSACVFPPYSLNEDLIQQIREQTEKLALGLGVVGLVNIQFAIKDNEIFILEVNPRASRTVPFVAKSLMMPIAKIATHVMVGKSLSEFNITEKKLPYVTVKEAVFPFNRFPGVDTLLGPEMKSTGEVMGIDKDFSKAFLKSQMAAGNHIPSSGTVFISVRDSDKENIVEIGQKFTSIGFKIFATRGTHKALTDNGIIATHVNKVWEGKPHVIDLLQSGNIDLVINTTEGTKSIEDSKEIRRTTLNEKIPYFTTEAGARVTVQAIEMKRKLDDSNNNTNSIEVLPLQNYCK